jgi:GNAT superfamily N-acetyltransferase
MIEVRPATLADLRSIAPRLRAIEREEMALLGVKPRHALARMYRESHTARAVTLDGVPVAAFGLRGALVGTEADAWMVTTAEVDRLPVAFFKTARAELARMLEGRSRLTSTIWGRQDAAVRAMAMLGFEVGPEEGALPCRRLTLTKLDGSRPRQPFIVYSLPRSRSFWTSRFLSYGRFDAYHDLPVSVDSIDELVHALERPNSGTVETGLSRAAPLLRQRLPQARVAVIRRPVMDSHRSASQAGWDVPVAYLEAEAARLDAIASRPGVLALDYADLDTETGAKRLFEHCLDRPFDRAWWLSLRDKNLQIDLDQRQRIIGSRIHAMTNLFNEIGQTVTIESEGFESFYRDGQALFDLHRTEAGPMDGLPFDPNIEMARALEAAGQLVVVTARCPNEGIVGYIVFLINPSFESRGVLLGYQNIFFVRRDKRGLGPQLHAHARAELQRRGVTQLVLRAGTRASGPKQAALFDRLGARYIGGLYSLSLEGC